MKKHSLIASFILATMILQAQPVINSADMMPVFGSQFTTSNIEFIDVSDETGSFVTWDYSELEVTEVNGTYTVVVASMTDNAASFPDAQFAWVSDDVTSYGSVNSNSQIEFGLSTEGEGGELLIMDYSDPRELLSFPLTMGDSGVDTYEGQLIVDGTAFADIEGSYSWIVDGYGTLVTEFGTYNNVLRVSNFYQETSILDFGEEQFTTTSEIEQYAYYMAGYNFPLAVFTTTIETDNEGNEDNYFDAIISTPENTSGILDFSEKVALSVFPNPCNDVLKVNLEKVDFTVNHFALADVTGRVVKNIPVNNSFSHAGYFEIPVMELPAGIYILNAFDADLNLKSSSRLIKN